MKAQENNSLISLFLSVFSSSATTFASIFPSRGVFSGELALRMRWLDSITDSVGMNLSKGR